MSTKEEVQDKESQLLDACVTTIVSPFREKYEEKWEEKAYWEAVETFKEESKKIGYEDPFEVLGKGRFTSFEAIRDILKAGPKPCFRKGWRSPYTGERVDILALVESLHHASGPKFEGKERIVIVDFWATWCDSCLEIAPELSDIFEKYAGRIAVISLNNDDMLHEQRKHSVEKTRTFLETKNESIRYSSYIDTEDHLARDFDNEVRYAGRAKFCIEEPLEEVLKELYPVEE
ncbi:hypothetical protein EC957_000937 [Mortierella hygrophila]|uniref:Thioredoxin domain-containing protein n=1 Tax=Mortierella hygrophila TaxID=979708 RepID=A0A9P6K2L4_9FUNG|nr:hypothetical protein EC957_000937 [Mortierella hygrophila]